MKFYKENELDKIIKSINENKLIILPTDTQMGIICKDPNKIYEIKERSESKKLITFTNILNSKNYSKKFNLLSNSFWPGKLTIIENKISYRMPNNKLILEILNVIGPIFSSSANISGEEPFNNSLDYKNYFNKEISKNVVVVVGECKESLGSTIFDLDSLKIIREGSINKKKIFEIIS